MQTVARKQQSQSDASRNTLSGSGCSPMAYSPFDRSSARKASCDVAWPPCVSCSTPCQHVDVFYQVQDNRHHAGPSSSTSTPASLHWVLLFGNSMFEGGSVSSRGSGNYVARFHLPDSFPTGVVNFVMAGEQAAIPLESLTINARVPIFPPQITTTIWELFWSMMQELDESQQLATMESCPHHIFTTHFSSLPPVMQAAAAAAWQDHFMPFATDMDYLLSCAPSCLSGSSSSFDEGVSTDSEVYHNVLTAMSNFLCDQGLWDCLVHLFQLVGPSGASALDTVALPGLHPYVLHDLQQLVQQSSAGLRRSAAYSSSSSICSAVSSLGLTPRRTGAAYLSVGSDTDDVDGLDDVDEAVLTAEELGRDRSEVRVQSKTNSAISTPQTPHTHTAAARGRSDLGIQENITGCHSTPQTPQPHLAPDESTSGVMMGSAGGRLQPPLVSPFAAYAMHTEPLDSTGKLAVGTAGPLIIHKGDTMSKRLLEKCTPAVAALWCDMADSWHRSADLLRRNAAHAIPLFFLSTWWCVTFMLAASRLGSHLLVMWLSSTVMYVVFALLILQRTSLTKSFPLAFHLFVVFSWCAVSVASSAVGLEWRNAPVVLLVLLYPAAALLSTAVRVAHKVGYRAHVLGCLIEFGAIVLCMRQTKSWIRIGGRLADHHAGFVSVPNNEHVWDQQQT